VSEPERPGFFVATIETGMEPRFCCNWCNYHFETPADAEHFCPDEAIARKRRAEALAVAEAGKLGVKP
jgi:hypothetical protein